MVPQAGLSLSLLGASQRSIAFFEGMKVIPKTSLSRQSLGWETWEIPRDGGLLGTRQTWHASYFAPSFDQLFVFWCMGALYSSCQISRPLGLLDIAISSHSRPCCIATTAWHTSEMSTMAAAILDWKLRCVGCAQGISTLKPQRSDPLVFILEELEQQLSWKLAPLICYDLMAAAWQNHKVSAIALRRLTAKQTLQSYK